MDNKFNKLKKSYENNDFQSILRDEYGIYFLKMRSFSRKNILIELAEKANVDIRNIKGKQLFQYLFDQDIEMSIIDEFINNRYKKERKIRKADEENLYNQLYRLPVLYWGGFYQNAVEQTIINNYVKKIANYDQLIETIENEINPKLKGYILSSWYNHWSSILIEDMFKDHPDILPTVGLIKKVDFFWHNFPFDLKVTYFPDGFMKKKRKELKLKPELTELKAISKQLKISINKDLKEKDLFTDLLMKLTESNLPEAKKFMDDFHQKRKEIIDFTISNPEELIRWFYENQGIRRFDAANRFFVVLIDRNNLEESWKLKRNKNLLSKNIQNYLNENKNIQFDKLLFSFTWKDKTYNTYAICLFIINE